MKLKQKIGTGALIALLVLVGVGIGAVCMLGNHVTPVVAGEENAEAAAQTEQAEYVPTEFRVINGIEYPVNENGLTYGGPADSDGDDIGDTYPDLIAVGDYDGEPGYAYKDDYLGLNDVTGLTLEQVLSGEYKHLITVYEIDGETVKGQWGDLELMIEEGLVDPIDGIEIVKTDSGNEVVVADSAK